MDSNAVLRNKFEPARKRITSPGDLKKFLESDSYREYMNFVKGLNDAVAHKKLSEAAQDPSEQVIKTTQLLDLLNSWVDDIPPIQQTMRYGNPAFRIWYSRLKENSRSLLEALLPAELHKAIIELESYFLDSFGNATRIDYGTGHETTFCAFLFCLWKLVFFKESDFPSLVARVFAKYADMMRRIQTTYWLEPAGSHGVWGLDDYCFLPFIWGSAQLIAHPLIRPKSIHNPEILEEFAPEYMYLGCIQFVKQVKKGPLQETSPIICDISQVPNWQKVNTGMFKMYHAELLSKVPIMQHFLFGSLIRFDDSGEEAEGS